MESRAGRLDLRAVDVLEIAPGLWRWATYYDDWKANVGCVYCETDDGVVLIDPLVPADEAERFWQALDRDVERVGGPVHVLLTVFWHVRSTAEVGVVLVLGVLPSGALVSALETAGSVVQDRSGP